MKIKSEVLESCGWPDMPFIFYNEPGEHDPCYVVMPGGCSLALNHCDVGMMDINRAKFIIDACNTALEKLSIKEEILNKVVGGMLDYVNENTVSDEEAKKRLSKYSGSIFKNYRKKNVQPMRPYIPGEDMAGISVNKEDTPELGGMIAVNPSNEEDRWYVAKKFFEENYIEA